MYAVASISSVSSHLIYSHLILSTPISVQSDKHAAIARRQTAAVVKQQLSDRLIQTGKSGVVLEIDFRLALYRHFVDTTRSKRRDRAKRSVFAALVSVTVNCRLEEKTARKVR